MDNAEEEMVLGRDRRKATQSTKLNEVNQTSERNRVKNVLARQVRIIRSQVTQYSNLTGWHMKGLGGSLWNDYS
jgi:hypothetical protein